jgi:hypothetical protein
MGKSRRQSHEIAKMSWHIRHSIAAVGIATRQSWFRTGLRRDLVLCGFAPRGGANDGQQELAASACQSHPSRASGWSSLTTPWGLPCCVRFPCVHAVATTPAQRPGLLLRSFTPAVSAFPERNVPCEYARGLTRSRPDISRHWRQRAYSESVERAGAPMLLQFLRRR